MKCRTAGKPRPKSEKWKRKVASVCIFSFDLFFLGVKQVGTDYIN